MEDVVEGECCEYQQDVGDAEGQGPLDENGFPHGWRYSVLRFVVGQLLCNIGSKITGIPLKEYESLLKVCLRCVVLGRQSWSVLCMTAAWCVVLVGALVAVVSVCSRNRRI